MRPLTSHKGGGNDKRETCITESGNKLHRGLPLPNLEPISPKLAIYSQNNPTTTAIPYQRERETKSRTAVRVADEGRMGSADPPI